VVKIPVNTVKEEDTVQQSTDEQQAAAQEDAAPELIDTPEEDTTLQEHSQQDGQDSSSQSGEKLGTAAKEHAREHEKTTEDEEDEATLLRKQLEAREQEAKEQYEARLRLQAELDNFKKRKEKEILDFRKYANENFIKELLTIVDDFERAIAAAEQTHKLEDFLQGVEMIFEKFLGVLKKKGVKEIEAEGQPFNPEIHEAVTQIETDEMEEGTVAAVFQKGYYLHDRVILAPKVAVAKKKDAE
jgi:molecular chaperone GrpE